MYEEPARLGTLTFVSLCSPRCMHKGHRRSKDAPHRGVFAFVADLLPVRRVPGPEVAGRIVRRRRRHGYGDLAISERTRFVELRDLPALWKTVGAGIRCVDPQSSLSARRVPYGLYTEARDSWKSLLGGSWQPDGAGQALVVQTVLDRRGPDDVHNSMTPRTVGHLAGRASPNRLQPLSDQEVPDQIPRGRAGGGGDRRGGEAADTSGRSC